MFIRNIRTKKIPEGIRMISFDEKKHFANVPLDRTFENIFMKVYSEKKPVPGTSIPEVILEGLLFLCRKQLFFVFDGKIYRQ